MLFRRLITKLRLSSRRKEPYLFWQSILGYKPKQLTLYQLALTHKSATRGGNERLEFLGDAVLGIVIAKQLYLLYPNEREGSLSRMRSKVVCRENLNHIAHKIGIDKHLILGQALKSNAENVYGNALEALIGAIYLDAGYMEAERFIAKHVVGVNQKNLLKLLEKEIDFKSRLLEWGQRHHKTITFRCIDDRYNIANDTHTFVYEVLIDDVSITQAAGHNKLLAQQRAARKVLDNI